MMITNKKLTGIYVHIPFCVSKCRYCGFFSTGGSNEEEQERYVSSLLEDIDEYGKVYGAGYIVDTVFIGGGTPSILKPELIADILERLRENFEFDDNPEITIESNPGTLTEKKLKCYKEAGINRLSIGLQSADDRMLENLGRIHSFSDFTGSFNLARKCGFDNINIDLMFAIPGHTMKIWKETLDMITELGPEHISFYSLQIEEGTPFYDMMKKGKLEQVSDETDRQMYHYAIRYLQNAGYRHYEISNCSLPGRECRHNLKYWSMDEYLGIGDSASSFIKGCRFTDSSRPELQEFHENTFMDNASEFVFTGLRKTDGISFEDFRKKTGCEFWDVFGDRRHELERYFMNGELIEENGILRLSETGIDISNHIMAVFV